MFVSQTTCWQHCSGVVLRCHWGYQVITTFLHALTCFCTTFYKYLLTGFKFSFIVYALVLFVNLQTCVQLAEMHVDIENNRHTIGCPRTRREKNGFIDYNTAKLNPILLSQRRNLLGHSTKFKQNLWQHSTLGSRLNPFCWI